MRTNSRLLLFVVGLGILVYWWAPWENGRTKVDRVKRKELFKTLGRLSETSAKVEGYVKAKNWAKAAEAGKEMIGHIDDANYFGIGDAFPFDCRRDAAKEFKLALVTYDRLVGALERGDNAQAESLEAKARKHFRDAFGWAAGY